MSDHPLPTDQQGRRSSTEGQLAKIAALLEELESQSAPQLVEGDAAPRSFENQLPLVRLGIAGGLYTALAAKHEPTAQHCLRVALGCSSWASKIGLDDDLRDTIELAALLHDVGKIGVPDAVLLKADALTPQETTSIERHWHTGLQILRSCCASSEVVEIVRFARTWYDGSRGAQESSGEGIPLGARILAIVDAFDSMLSDQVYRRAMPWEVACNELLRFAGTQFDPSLVVLFIKLFDHDQLERSDAVTRRWLHELDPCAIDSQWRRNETRSLGGSQLPEEMFHQKLLDNMHDGVVFLDSSSRILLWNHGAERLTGIAGTSVVHRLFQPSVLRMRDEKGKLIKDDHCPVAHAIQNGVQWLRRLMIKGRTGREVAVDAHAVPVIAADGTTLGVTLLLHDASSEMTLEERCQSLHEMATRDPLTQVANRAEFDRVHAAFVAAHLESKRPCSMIIADIDRFKRINDTFGHPAGDAIIQSFAKVLQNAARPGDLVARYGGEEFVMLCADCDNASVAVRGEEVRRMFSELRQSVLDSQCASASFGVTEIQPGDTPETMLHRADRALLLAKETGRNKVVQLGAGNSGHDDSHGPQAATSTSRGTALLMQDMSSQSAIDRTIEKLRGFVADQEGELTSVEGHCVQIKFGSTFGSFFRRNSDRHVPMLMDVSFEEDQSDLSPESSMKVTRTRIHVEVRPQRDRDRRQGDAMARARQLLVSLRSYLMAIELSPNISGDALTVDPAVVEAAERARKPGLLGRLFGHTPPPQDDRR